MTAQERDFCVAQISGGYFMVTVGRAHALVFAPLGEQCVVDATDVLTLWRPAGLRLPPELIISSGTPYGYQALAGERL